MDAAVVIPAFNEAASIGCVVEEVRRIATPIVVDDGSSDDTGARAEAAGARTVRHEVNRGYDAALATGFAEAARAGARVIAAFDADGQLDREALTRAIAMVAQGPVRLVIGVRPRGARLAERAFNLYTRLRFGVPDILCGLKAVRADAYREHRQAMLPGGVFTGLVLALLRHGEPFALVDVPVRPRIGKPRFGGTWRANMRMFAALGGALVDDLRGR